MILDRLRGECLHTVRLLQRAPLFASTVVITLGLAIGATTALFAIVHAVVLAPLPYRSPDRVVAVWETAVREGYSTVRVAPGNFADWSAQNRVFTTIAMFGAGTWQATGEGEPQQLQGAAVGPAYFDVLGVEPILGRRFTEADMGPEAGPVAILSHGVWQRMFGGRTDIIGRPIRLDGTPVTIVGVMPDGVYPAWPQTSGSFNFLPGYQQIWRPLKLPSEFAATRRSHVFGAIARLRPGVSLDEAQRGMAEIAERLARDHPASNDGAGVLVRSLADEVASEARPTLYVLMAAVGVTLLAACANVANLMLLRSAARRRELAVRATLGATRGSVIRLVSLESLVLAAAAGATGIGVARAALHVLVALAPYEMPRASEIALTSSAFVAGCAATLLAAALVGLLPTMYASRLDLRGALQGALYGDGRSAASVPSSRRMRRALIAFEVAIAVVLLVGALLAARSFAALRAVDAGFTPDHALAFELSLPRSSGESIQRIDAFQMQLLERLAVVPSVRDVAIGYDLPLEATWVDSFQVEGRGARGPDDASWAVLKIVSPGYFRTLSVRSLRGRVFTDDDRAGRPGVVLVNEAFARLVFRGEDPIGRHLTLRTPSLMYGNGVPSRYEIVGIVGNVHSRGLDVPPEPAYYLSVRQFPQGLMTVYVRTDRTPGTAMPSNAMPSNATPSNATPSNTAAAIREAVRSIDPSLPIVNMQPLEAHLNAALARPRFLFTVLVAFATAALLLAILGVHGLLAYVVQQRRSELAVRQALGATRRDIVRLVLGEGVLLTFGGALMGLATAVALGRSLSSVLYQVEPGDPLALTVAPATIVGSAAIAALIPAWRAARMDAAAALRGE